MKHRLIVCLVLCSFTLLAQKPVSALKTAPEKALRLTGDPADAVMIDQTLEGPFTLEAWVRLAPGMDQNDSLLARKGDADANFFKQRFRFYAGPKHGDVVTANRPMMPEVWTHCAVTRDADNAFELYLDGEAVGGAKRPHAGVYRGLNIGLSNAGGGSAFDLHELRIWDRALSAKELQAGMQTTLAQGDAPAGLLRHVSATTPNLKLQGKAAVANMNEIRSTTFGEQRSATGIRHSFLIAGPQTVLVDEDGRKAWSIKGSSRDIYQLPNGNILTTIANVAKEVTREGKMVWRYKKNPANRELGTALRLKNGNTLVVERGPKPRLLELTPAGDIAVDVPLKPESDNGHMQTRMARKLPNGNYIVPHLLAFAVKEYEADGSIVRTIKTDLPSLGGRKAETWPFTAILLGNGNYLVTLTHGNQVAEFTPDGKVVWVITNEDVGGRLADPCGAQRLANGNTVICSYAQKNPKKPKLFEVTPDKKVVWEFFHPSARAHGLHVLTTNGTPEAALK